MRTSEADVLVVGAGPAGLTASALLARSGVDVDAITVTKYPQQRQLSPRPHHQSAHRRGLPRPGH